jgi:predicted amidophosphoribosyltransferase
VPAAKIKPMKLPATAWVEGYVLDYHTVSSTPTGDPYYRFDTKRTELGELLCVVPAPPSLARKTQPAVEVARELATRLRVPVFEDAVIKVKATPQMKNIDDWSERQRVLGEAIQAGPSDVKGKSILLFDDLIESGSTLRRAAEVLLKDGGARAIYALVLTRTK